MQLHLSEPTIPPSPQPLQRRAIECADFPFEELSRVAEAESWRKEIYRPMSHIHKWWAQRLGSVFRGILLGSVASEGVDLMELFYSPARMEGKIVFDPFMGSGITIGETLKLGGRAVGRDINPVAYFQVLTALTLPDREALIETLREIEMDVGREILGRYKTRLLDGTECQVLYYFWVMQATCPECEDSVDLFSKYQFTRHAYPLAHPGAKAVCPKCSSVLEVMNGIQNHTCHDCGHAFDPSSGPVKGKSATCPSCSTKFSIADSVRTAGTHSYRMYAKLLLTPDGDKLYERINEYDENLYQQTISELEAALHRLPEIQIEPGRNTNQVLNYGFNTWKQMFNPRQLLCLSALASRISKIENPSLRNAFTCLFSGALEFNNMFASFKGEGTGAVRHMFYHHILKPERTPLEANVWGTPKSSGAFSTLFSRRLLRAVEYAESPFELETPSENSKKGTSKIFELSAALHGFKNSDSYEQFDAGGPLYLSCGDSARTDLADGIVDIVVTDPPFFDNVHYSELADFFYVWQRLILDDMPEFENESTRSPLEVQNSNSDVFTTHLGNVFKESSRVLKDDGLFIFTYHHSRWEGWESVLKAIVEAGLRVERCHPIKAEMSVATPKHQAKEPIDFDIIIVCRKRLESNECTESNNELTLTSAIQEAESQVERLRVTGWSLSRNDVGVILMSQIVAHISQQTTRESAESILQEAEKYVESAIDNIHLFNQRSAPV